MEITALTVASLISRAAGAMRLPCASRDRTKEVVAWGTMADAADRTSIATDIFWALRRDRTHVVTDASQGVLCQHAGVDLPAHAGTACIRLSAQGRQLEMLVPRSDDPRDLASSTMAEAVAEKLSLALQNLCLRETLRQQSICGPLTGLYNRRNLEEALNHEPVRCVRQMQPLPLPLPVPMLDVELNDLHGHGGGDRVLAAISVCALA